MPWYLVNIGAQTMGILGFDSLGDTSQSGTLLQWKWQRQSIVKNTPTTIENSRKQSKKSCAYFL
jgi:hypothetical protein